MIGIEPVGQLQGGVGRGGRSELDPERIAYGAQQLHVRAVQLPGPLADPDEVTGGVVRLPGAGVDPGQGVLVLQDQRLVAGVEVDGPEHVVVDAAGHHEGQGSIDLVGQVLVLHPGGGVLDEVGVPAVHAAQVREAAGDEGPGQIEDRRGGVVDAEQPLRIGLARLGGEGEPVHRIPAVRRQRDPFPGLARRAAGLGELAGQPAHLDDRHLGGVGQHHGHGEQGAQLALDVGGRHPVEGLGAVPALQDEGLAGGHAGHLGPQFIAFAGEDQRRQGTQLGHHLGHRIGVGIVRLLRWIQRMQRRQRGNLGRLGHADTVDARPWPLAAFLVRGTRPTGSDRPIRTPSSPCSSSGSAQPR